jgi:hypothetical protein
MILGFAALGCLLIARMRSLRAVEEVDVLPTTDKTAHSSASASSVFGGSATLASLASSRAGTVISAESAVSISSSASALSVGGGGGMSLSRHSASTTSPSASTSSSSAFASTSSSAVSAGLSVGAGAGGGGAATSAMSLAQAAAAARQNAARKAAADRAKLETQELKSLKRRGAAYD